MPGENAELFCLFSGLYYKEGLDGWVGRKSKLDAKHKSYAWGDVGSSPTA